MRRGLYHDDARPWWAVVRRGCTATGSCATLRHYMGLVNADIELANPRDSAIRPMRVNSLVDTGTGVASPGRWCSATAYCSAP